MKIYAKRSKDTSSALHKAQRPFKAPQAGATAPSSGTWQASSVRLPPVFGSPAGGLRSQQLKENPVGSQMLAVPQAIEVQGLHEPSDEEIRSAAAEGIRTPAVALPFLDRIQASFGCHSIGHVKAHVGPKAARASRAMSARAFASGDHIVFGGTPDLRIAAHEAAHAVQQKAGVQLAGEVGREGDRYERNADAVADAVVAGRSAEGLLEPVAVSRGVTTTSQARGAVVQRWIWLAIDKDSYITTKQDTKRPPGGLPGGSQGDHTTPYTSLQDQVANSLEGTLLDDAWGNLKATLDVYKLLPGWAESKKWTTDTVGPYVEGLLKNKGDINALQLAANEMLVLRNQIALTSLKKGGYGNAEGKWAGSLQYQERQFQLGHKPMLKKEQVIEYIWKAFDHGRVNNLDKDTRVSILKQHAITMADAYPQLNAFLGIDADDILGYYPKKKWLTYDPG